MNAKVKVLLNHNPARMIPIGCAAPSQHRGWSELCGGAHAGDTFDSFEIEFPFPTDTEGLPMSILHFDAGTIDHHVLDHAFMYGNEDERTVWPKDRRSLSIGDVLILGESAVRVHGVGMGDSGCRHGSILSRALIRVVTSTHRE